MTIQSLNPFGIMYVGVRTNHIDEMKQFAEQVLGGYEKTHDNGAVAGLKVPDMEVAMAWTKALKDARDRE